MSSLDWPAIGQAVGATLISVGALASGAYAWWLKQRRDSAETRAEVAESDAGRSVADAQSTIYGLLTQRLASIEGELKTLREELRVERQHSRRLELHIWRLEGLMRNAGIEPPVFSDADVVNVEGHR